MTRTVRWTMDITALSSISHSESALGGSSTKSLFRREKVIQPSGVIEEVPIISGNSLRGILRRTGEALLRDVLEYEGQIPLAAAHALVNGGSLAKTQNEPLSGRRLAELRSLNPLISVFGGCGGGRIINGCLQVGKTLPVMRETLHLLTNPPASTATDRFNGVAMEEYSRLDDNTRRPLSPPGDDQPEAEASQLMRFGVETLPAGTQLQTWIRLDRASNTELSFMSDVLEAYVDHGHLGGRSNIGHGQVRVDLQGPAHSADIPPWREILEQNRARALEVLTWLT